MPPLDRGVPRQPVPALPAGVGNLREFGRDVMKWGRGDEARQRAQTLTRQELLDSGVTLEIAGAWRDFYENESLRNPGNRTAEARAELMQRVVDLLSANEESNGANG